MNPDRIVTIGPTFINAAGSIANLLELSWDEEPIRGVSLIRSHAGSERSNHYHRTDTHWLYCVSGEMHYYERAIGASEYPHPLIVTPGRMVFTPAMVEHKTVFPVDTVLLSLSRFARDAAAHEADLVRVKR